MSGKKLVEPLSKLYEAKEKIYWTLVAYIEDCAGAESDEAKEINEAWLVITKEIGDK
jgi:hypothetical protein